METRKILRANDGKVLTNGKTHGRVVYLAEGDDGSAHYEITEEEYEKIIDVTPENMATEQDYQNALRSMGVGV